ncbi:hypothetical protein B0H14DRAFT_3434694 [Mycena olivaceomarginata]|nr:hypothetical protein B0H14DRAFT_3434694 [Mycena olivaceomarginata]
MLICLSHSPPVSFAKVILSLPEPDLLLEPSTPTLQDLSGRLLKPSRRKQASQGLKNAPLRRFEPYPTLATYLVPMLCSLDSRCLALCPRGSNAHLSLRLYPPPSTHKTRLKTSRQALAPQDASRPTDLAEDIRFFQSVPGDGRELPPSSCSLVVGPGLSTRAFNFTAPTYPRKPTHVKIMFLICPCPHLPFALSLGLGIVLLSSADFHHLKATDVSLLTVPLLFAPSSTRRYPTLRALDDFAANRRPRLVITPHDSNPQPLKTLHKPRLTHPQNFRSQGLEI